MVSECIYTAPSVRKPISTLPQRVTAFNGAVTSSKIYTFYSFFVKLSQKKVFSFSLVRFFAESQRNEQKNYFKLPREYFKNYFANVNTRNCPVGTPTSVDIIHKKFSLISTQNILQKLHLYCIIKERVYALEA